MTSRGKASSGQTGGGNPVTGMAVRQVGKRGSDKQASGQAGRAQQQWVVRQAGGQQRVDRMRDGELGKRETGYGQERATEQDWRYAGRTDTNLRIVKDKLAPTGWRIQA